MSERERMAEVWVNEQICFGGLEFPRGGETFKDCVKSYLAGWDAAIEAAAKVAEEHGGGRWYSVAPAIRALGGGEQKVGGEE